ncbi:BA14K family protein [Caulobacter sp. 602-1]|uniref:BA14K family protein n=1 Tax=Caulobacter sp. 602-1 TaxID=2492472 RepID=UPI000F630801|nr:BA14K family protein [Caulobacter sp. 602-1]RRN64300.1 BA14K family protein [Caulobacter sp. 602-1]
MRKVLLTGALALALAIQGPVAALAQAPHRPSHDPHRFERRPPPSGWSQRQWDYRQDYLRRHGDRRDDHDEAIIAGLLGFALGAAIAGSQQEKERVKPRLSDPDWIAYCARKYRSFDPRSGTYLGYDGLRRYCE